MAVCIVYLRPAPPTTIAHCRLLLLTPRLISRGGPDAGGAVLLSQANWVTFRDSSFEGATIDRRATMAPPGNYHCDVQYMPLTDAVPPAQLLTLRGSHFPWKTVWARLVCVLTCVCQMLQPCMRVWLVHQEYILAAKDLKCKTVHLFICASNQPCCIDSVWLWSGYNLAR